MEQILNISNVMLHGHRPSLLLSRATTFIPVAVVPLVLADMLTMVLASAVPFLQFYGNPEPVVSASRCISSTVPVHPPAYPGLP
jgi:hypothetical protein